VQCSMSVLTPMLFIDCSVAKKTVFILFYFMNKKKKKYIDFAYGSVYSSAIF
jgi:hypothetical protein